MRPKKPFLLFFCRRRQLAMFVLLKLITLPSSTLANVCHGKMIEIEKICTWEAHNSVWHLKDGFYIPEQKWQVALIFSGAVQCPVFLKKILETIQDVQSRVWRTSNSTCFLDSSCVGEGCYLVTEFRDFLISLSAWQKGCSPYRTRQDYICSHDEYSWSAFET